MNNAIRWPGSKAYMADRIIPLIPRDSHYVEVFGGGAAVLLRKPRSTAGETYNDVAGVLVNFFRTARDRGDELLHQLSRTPYAREELRAATRDHPDDLERARRFFVECWQSIPLTATDGPGTFASKHEYQGFWDSANANLPLVIERLRGVIIEQRDWRVLLADHDDSDSCLYLDPPYVFETYSKSRGYYTHDFTDDDHEELVEMILASAATFIISGHAHPIYAPLERAGYVRSEYGLKRMGAIAFRGSAKQAVECVWARDPTYLRLDI